MTVASKTGRPRLAVAVVALALGALAVVGCASPTVVGHTPSGIAIVRLPLRNSNAYLVRAPRPFVIDAGSQGEGDTIVQMVEAVGVKAKDVHAVIATHGHCDHRGAAPELQRRGLPIWLGAGDSPMARAGRNDELRPTSVGARFIHLLFSDRCEPFEPNVQLDQKRTLAEFGIEDEVFPLPGHTPGSVVIVLEGRTAFVGDILLGGNLGGAIFSQVPGEHYLQADRAKNRRNLEWLMARGIDDLYVGHGGPLKRADVLRALEDGTL
jgi:hydroxyacylglutathione hydrolase